MLDGKMKGEQKWLSAGLALPQFATHPEGTPSSVIFSQRCGGSGRAGRAAGRSRGGVGVVYGGVYM